MPPWQLLAAHEAGSGGVAVFTVWQVEQVVMNPEWGTAACTPVGYAPPWQVSQGPIPPIACVNVGSAAALDARTALSAMAASTSSRATG